MLYNIKRDKLSTKRSFRVSNHDCKMKQCSSAEGFAPSARFMKFEKERLLRIIFPF